MRTRKKKFRYLPITSSDALPLSYRRLVGAKAIKLASVIYMGITWDLQTRIIMFQVIFAWPLLLFIRWLLKEPFVLLN